MNETIIEITEAEKAALKGIGSIGANHTARALSQMVGRTVGISVPAVGVNSLKTIPNIFDRAEEMVTGVHLQITGDLEGTVLLLLPKASALTLADLMMKREAGTTKRLTEADESALKELGNILTGNCLSAVADFLGMKLVEGIPHIASDMVGAIMEAIIAEHGPQSEQALMLKMHFYTKKASSSSSAELAGYLILLLKPKGSDALLTVIRTKLEHAGGGARRDRNRSKTTTRSAQQS